MSMCKYLEKHSTYTKSEMYFFWGGRNWGYSSEQMENVCLLISNLINLNYFKNCFSITI